MYSVIKIGGFAFSLAACVLIALYIKDELSYDRSNPNAERIYRVVGYYDDNGNQTKWASFPAPLAGVIKANYPEVETVGRLMPNNVFTGAGSNEVRSSNQVVNTYEDGFTYGDQQLLDVLGLSMVYGNKTDALKEPLSMLITKKKADKYFPGQNAIGKIMYLNNDKSKPYRVTGVIPDFPATSHLKYDFILTLSGVNFGSGEQTDWGSNNYTDYVLVRPGANITQLEKKMTTDITRNYYLPSMLRSGDKDAEKELKKLSLHLQPVGDINLYSSDIQDNLSHGDIRFIWLFGAVASFILIIACINFINLSTAKATNRAKEVGIRKVVGSKRSGLITQFLTESLFLSLLSFIIALVIAGLLLPYFNTLASKSLNIPWAEWRLIPALFIAAMIVGLLAGLYPSFYLSAFNPIQVLKGNISTGSKGAGLRNGLVVFQFTTSIILIISTVIIYSQMQYMLNRKAGFDKDQIVMIQGSNVLGNNVKSFKNELSKQASVKSVSISDYLPVAGTKRNGNSFWKEGKMKEESGIIAQLWQVDDTYLNTLGMKLLEGRSFSEEIPGDTQSVILNESMVKQLGLKSPVGKRITNGGIFTVIGVVQDFNFESMRDHIQPLALQYGLSPSIVSVKVKTADMKNTLQSITDIWKSFAPDQSMRYTFLDERFANMYADVQRMSRIFTSFAILAIMIACLGLFALSAFMAEQRSKEIGIRKVLGAGVSRITTLLSVDFIKPVLIAMVIASPIAWWAMHQWLQDFAYRISIQWWVFVLAGLGAVLIALLTISFQSIKAAVANPVDSLKSR
jgi:putative ABC transport system permease protein